MNPFARWQGGEREVAVIGLGRSGIAAARLLNAMSVAVYASDQNQAMGQAPGVIDLRERGVAIELGHHDYDRIRRAVAVVLSPGVPPDAEAVRAAREGSNDIRAEVDLGFEALPDDWHTICVTGTNGKTTTTALIAHLLQSAGVSAQAVGNIGVPLCDAILSPSPPRWMVVELSSFQLHDTRHHRPTVGLLTNLAPDHLDRYPSVDAYYADKRRLFLHASPSSIWVLNRDDAQVAALVASVEGQQLMVSLDGEADGWYDREGQVLRVGPDLTFPRSNLPLLGDHNVANTLMAVLAAQATEIPLASLWKGVGCFSALPHRLEPIRVWHQIHWINDSKATNLSSTSVAAAAMDRPFVLLLGGRHKGEPYDRLLPMLAGRCREVVCYGESAPLIEGDLGAHLAVKRATSLEEAVALAGKDAHQGDAVLLSPACSSYDMFRSFEERGERFRIAVEDL